MCCTSVGSKSCCEAFSGLDLGLGIEAAWRDGNFLGGPEVTQADGALGGNGGGALVGRRIPGPRFPGWAPPVNQRMRPVGRRLRARLAARATHRQHVSAGFSSPSFLSSRFSRIPRKKEGRSFTTNRSWDKIHVSVLRGAACSVRTFCMRAMSPSGTQRDRRSSGPKRKNSQIPVQIFRGRSR